MWHEETREARESGDLVVLGVIQEQHADRCRLFAQWKGFHWTIVQDPINLLGARAVPMFVALDEAGTIVDANLKVNDLADFLSRPAPDKIPNSSDASELSFDQLQRTAQESGEAADWIAAGDQRLLWGGDQDIGKAISCYRQAVEANNDSAAGWFRLGVAFRKRYDSSNSRSDDFANAADAWDRALEIDPNHYIYRRRIQQYGPRLSKPYPFYDWISQAREDLEARGETPIRLVAEPVGAEIASPAKDVIEQRANVQSPDADGRITRDFGELIRVDVVVVPGEIKAGGAARVHLKMTPSATAHWNNEVDAPQIWVDVPEGWKIDQRLMTLAQPTDPESRESRKIDFEIGTPDYASSTTLKGYALDYVCEDIGGQCLYRRQDFEIPIRIAD